MNEQTIGSGNGVSLSIGILLGEYGGGSLTGDSEGKMNYQGWVEEGSGDGCLSLSGSLWGTWRGGPFTGNCER